MDDPSAAPEGRPRTGFARRRAGDYAARQIARDFAGLPPEFTHPKQLLEPLRAAGARLPFPREDLDVLAVLVDFTSPADWIAGGEPMVWPSNDELAGRTGRHPNDVSRRLARLRAGGAIDVRYGPGNRRHPVFDARGTVVEKYGIDLRPLAALAQALRPVAQAQAQRRASIRRIVARITETAQDCRQHLDAARAPEAAAGPARLSELAVLAGRTEALRLEVRTLQARDHQTGDAGQAEHDRRLLTLAAEAATAGSRAFALAADLFPMKGIADSLSGLNESADDDSTTENPINTKKSKANQKKVAPVSDDGPRDADYVPLSQETARQSPRITVQRLATLSPLFERRLESHRLKTAETATADDIEIIGRQVATGLGLSVPALQQAILRHGGMVVALAALAAAEQPHHRIRTSRAALLAGMLRKPPDQLNPLASLFGLAAERRRARSSGGRGP